MNKLALAGACLVLSAVSAHAQYVDGLPAATSVSSGDLVPVIQGSTPVVGGGFLPGSGTARRATVGQVQGIPIGTPSSSSASCTAGTREADASYLYVCIAANTWKRVALSAF